MPAKLGAIYPQQPTYFTPRYSRLALIEDGAYTTSVPAVATPTTNLAIYSPLTLEVPVLITSFAWCNGSAASLNVDVGIYDANGTKLGTSTGSVAQSGASAMQSAAPSGGSFVVGPGRFYVAMQFSGNTANTMLAYVFTSIQTIRVCGCLEEAVGSFGLPATATFATVTTLNVPQMGILATPLASNYRAVTPVSINPWSVCGSAIGMVSGINQVMRGAASTAWPAANRALYFNVILPSPVILAQAYVFAGATSVNTNHFDIGLYMASGEKILTTGSTAWSGTTNALNVVNITDTYILAGQYIIALALDTNTDTVFRSTAATLGNAQILGHRQEAAAFALPATITPAVLVASYVPVFGFTQAAVI